MTFSRTSTGKKIAPIFHGLPIIYVEGPYDVVFIRELTRAFKCRVKEAGGKEECSKLVKGLLEDNPAYLVMLDGDYEILGNRRSKHRRAIFLQRYSAENYFWDFEILQDVIQEMCCVDSREEVISQTEFDNLERHLKLRLNKMVSLDITRDRVSGSVIVMPKKPDRLLKTSKAVSFCNVKISKFIKNGNDSLSITEKRKSRHLVNEYCNVQKFTNLVRGHFLFGVIRHFLKACLKKRKRGTTVLTNHSLFSLLSRSTWSLRPHQDHIRLRSKVASAIRECKQILAA
ncbi:DUF4435 domain-containing protein [bacterium AH-315-J21]|nr:DUF4435 domain-containing protein [bacterium AH-315-J21]